MNFLEIVKEYNEEQKIKEEINQIKLKYKDDARLRKIELNRAADKRYKLKIKNGIIERKNHYKKKPKEITPENPSENYIKYKGTNGNRQVIICECANCEVKFEKTKKSYKQAIEKCKNLFCDRNCFNEFVKAPRKYLNCDNCGDEFDIKLSSYNHLSKTNKHFFCWKKCADEFITHERFKFNCGFCNTIVERAEWELNKNGNYYCTYECMYKCAKTDRSYLEEYLESKLIEFFPYIKFIPCDRKICNGLELDFYFPGLYFAIEINGIYHYKQVHKNGNLELVQKHDRLKNQMCKEEKIDLFTIKSIENFTSKGIKQRDWKIFKNILMSKIPYCETKEDCISELYNPKNNMLEKLKELILDYGIRTDFHIRKPRKINK